MNGLYTIILLILSNIFMTLAWYGHLRLQQSGVSSNWPLLGVIAFSWCIAFFEYCFRLRRQWWAFHSGAAESGAGMHLAGCLRCDCQYHVPAPDSALEPHIGFPAYHLCGLSGIYEIELQ